MSNGLQMRHIGSAIIDHILRCSEILNSKLHCDVEIIVAVLLYY